MKTFLLCCLLLVAACDDSGSTDPNLDMEGRPDAGNSPDVGAEPDAQTTRADASSADMGGAPDAAVEVDAGDLRPLPLQSTIDAVQPMTGIVLWEDSWQGDPARNAVQLEYAYVGPDTIITAKDTYDWNSFDAFLDRIAGRGHQAVVRFYYTYPGEQTTVPQYIKDLNDYDETRGQSEGQQTSFPDWTNAELQRAHLAFYTTFADRYDDDPRIAFLQVGFGLWGEYHIYDGPNVVGEQFPSKAFQTQFLTHMDDVFDNLKWSISIDAGDDYYSPFASNAALLDLGFGNFDDSFMHEQHGDYNEMMWTFFGYTTRYETQPHGGELSYYTNFDQQHALDVAGIYGRTYEELSAKFHISYMIGNDQPDYQAPARIRDAGMANGYKFTVTAYEASSTHVRVTIENSGIAPIYYDAYPSVNGVRAGQSLKGLLPGDSMTAVIASAVRPPTLTIESDRLVAGQVIQFAADL